MDQPTQQLPPAPRPRRRPRVLVLSAVLGVLLVTGVLAAVFAAGNRTPAQAEENLDLLFAPAVGAPAAAQDPSDAQDPTDEPPPAHANRPFRHGRHGPLRLKEGEKVVAGTIVSVGTDNLVVRKDNGAEVTVPTDSDTRVHGKDKQKLSDLKAGERVIVKAGADGKADGVLTVRAHAVGTITRLDGDRATLVSPGGMNRELDLSGVPQRPAVGTMIVAVGTAADGGETLKVEQLKELPTLG